MGPCIVNVFLSTTHPHLQSDCVCGPKTLTSAWFNFETLSSQASMLGSYVDGVCWDVKTKLWFTVWMLSLCSGCTTCWVFIGRQQSWLCYQRALTGFVVSARNFERLMKQAANSDWEITPKLRCMNAEHLKISLWCTYNFFSESVLFSLQFIMFAFPATDRV